MFSKDINVRTAAILYLGLAIFGMIALMVIPSTLIVDGDVTATINNIMESEGLFRMGIASELIAQAIYLFLGIAFYKLFSKVDKTQASILVALVVAAVPVAFITEINHLAVLLLLNGANYSAVFGAEQFNALVMFFLDMHESGILIAGIFWGLWLFPLGILVYKSGFFPKILGILLMIACCGYVMDTFVQFVFPDAIGIVSQIALIMEMGEVIFMLWLVIRGANSQTQNQYNLVTA